MPYIKAEDRIKVAVRGAFTPGELAYLITLDVLAYANTVPPNFETYNAIVGVLDNVKDEFKRRILNPYEDQKRKENGDVFERLT